LALPVTADKVDIDWDNPQWLELGLAYQYTERDIIFFSAGWQDWSAFGKNQLAFSGGLVNPVSVLDRNFKDTWYAGIAYVHTIGNNSAYSIGFSYDSSPVDDDDRTFDLPMDEIYKLSGSYSWKGTNELDYSIGGTLYLVGDADIDSTNQGVRVKGDFDSNIILFLGATLRYRF
jgi:long-chain fatty acid transport protein